MNSRSQNNFTTVQLEVVTNSNSNNQDAQFDRNSDWLEAHASEVYAKHRGKHLCVAGEELFVGDSLEEALAIARSAHPGEEGVLVRYVPLKNIPRIYAH